jgi:hypothetical protein
MPNRASIEDLGEGAEGRGPLLPPLHPQSTCLSTVARASCPCLDGLDARATALREEAEGEGRGDCVSPVLSSASLLFLATVHGDPAGYHRAWGFFEKCRPELITVEISRFSVRYRERAVKGWRRQLAAALKALPPEAAGSLAVARAAAQTEAPFEYRAARDWGEAHQVPVKLLDRGDLARRHLPRYADELLTAENLRCLAEQGAAGTLEEFVAAEFRRARLAREGKLRVIPGLADTGDSRRERHWARRLRVLAATGKRVVHLGGWEHLVPRPGGGGLFGLLGDLQPRVMLLDEVGQI